MCEKGTASMGASWSLEVKQMTDSSSGRGRVPPGWLGSPQEHDTCGDGV